MYQEYTRVGDLEVEGKLLLSDENLCPCRKEDAAFTDECCPSAEEFRSCVELLNELKDKFNALIGALT